MLWRKGVRSTPLGTISTSTASIARSAAGRNGDRIEGTDHYNFKYIPDHSIAGGLAYKIKRFLVSGVVISGPPQVVRSGK